MPGGRRGFNTNWWRGRRAGGMDLMDLMDPMDLMDGGNAMDGARLFAGGQGAGALEDDGGAGDAAAVHDMLAAEVVREMRARFATAADGTVAGFRKRSCFT